MQLGSHLRLSRQALRRLVQCLFPSHERVWHEQPLFDDIAADQLTLRYRRQPRHLEDISLR